MQELKIHKMSGHGNDFIIVDNRAGQVAEADYVPLARGLCRRAISVGADGMIFIVPGARGQDFAWRFFNADGSEAEMCGNASRCTAWLAMKLGISGANPSFGTMAGVIRAEVGSDTVKVLMTPPGALTQDLELTLAGGEKIRLDHINTGVPHAVIWTQDVEKEAIVETGRQVRFHEHFKPAGTNVNFAQVDGEHRIINRTYERGVEDETLACGTGSIAAVLAAAARGLALSPVRVTTRMGEDLIIHFNKDQKSFTDIYLEGPVRHVFSGTIGPDALR